MTLTEKILDEILNYKEEFKAGEQRAFMMANVLKHCNIIIVGSKQPQIIKNARMFENRSHLLKTLKTW